ncbi:hypothetical protein QBC34DRAFT_435569 [Podospora aff. communis PSN243]|uniref:Uncharacterized protein n=1 Tax=Podospora aff. communis PSN243 TaxID=3040156 RepID=A0AAV9H1J2_9PEZI|nr:hypothetical protein QBC34DRAFT_435569 [Podospora aff. communis PSN243]
MFSSLIFLATLATPLVTALPLDGPTSEAVPEPALMPIDLTLPCGCWNDCTIEQVAKPAEISDCLTWCDPRYACPDLPTALPTLRPLEARGIPTIPTPDPVTDPVDPEFRTKTAFGPDPIFTPIFPPLSRTLCITLPPHPITNIDIPTATNVVLGDPPKPTRIPLDLKGLDIPPPDWEIPATIVIPEKGWVDPPPPELIFPAVKRGEGGSGALMKRGVSCEGSIKCTFSWSCQAEVKCEVR